MPPPYALLQAAGRVDDSSGAERKRVAPSAPVCDISGARALTMGNPHQVHLPSRLDTRGLHSTTRRTPPPAALPIRPTRLLHSKGMEYGNKMLIHNHCDVASEGGTLVCGLGEVCLPCAVVVPSGQPEFPVPPALELPNLRITSVPGCPLTHRHRRAWKSIRKRPFVFWKLRL